MTIVIYACAAYFVIFALLWLGYRAASRNLTKRLCRHAEALAELEELERRIERLEARRAFERRIMQR